MRNLSLAAIALSLTFATTGCFFIRYVVDTNFHQLEYGMTKAEFENSWGESAEHLRGGTPVSSRMIRKGPYIWEVWVYEVYGDVAFWSGLRFVHHEEYVAFKNGRLEEWGRGSGPIELQAHTTRRPETSAASVPPADWFPPNENGPGSLRGRP